MCLVAQGGEELVQLEMAEGQVMEEASVDLFLELLGAREKGVRMTMLMPAKQGMLAKITAEVAQLGGKIVALGTSLGEDSAGRLVAKMVDARNV
jgi:acetoin utilization protein AcuB